MSSWILWLCLALARSLRPRRTFWLLVGGGLEAEGGWGEMKEREKRGRKEGKRNEERLYPQKSIT